MENFNRVIHPRSEVYKKYKVKILGILKTEDINKLKRNCFGRWQELACQS